MLEMALFKTRVRLIFVGFLLVLGSSAAEAANPVKGAEIYNLHCAACHGGSGMAVMPGAPNFARNERMVRPDAFILEDIKRGKNAMPAYQGVLSDRDILDVISYMRTLN